MATTLLKTPDGFIAGLTLGLRPSGEELLSATMGGDSEHLHSLLTAKANVNELNKLGRTPLFYARNADVAKLLLDHKARLKTQESFGNSSTALHWAAINNHADVVRVLVQRKASLAATDTLGFTPLHHAAAYNRPIVAESLIELKASLAVNNKDGQSPLHLTATRNNVEVAKVLLQHRADVSAATNRGVTALDLAMAHHVVPPGIAPERRPKAPEIIGILEGAKQAKDEADGP